MQRRFPSRNQWLTISWTKTDRGQFHCESIHHFELLSSLCSVKKSSQLFNKVKETLIPLFLYLSSGFFCQPPSNFQPSGGKNLSWGSSNWKEDIKRLYESSQWKICSKGRRTFWPCPRDLLVNEQSREARTLSVFSHAFYLCFASKG